jgi:signal transduction histidine kinase
MKILSSLTNRIFLGSAALAVLTIVVAVYRFNVAVTAQAENELRRGLEEAGTLLEENRATLVAHFSREARLVADLSNMKAALSTKDPPTIEPIAAEYQRRIGSDLLVVSDPSGRVLSQAGRLRMPDVPAAHDAIRAAARGHEVVSLWPHPGGLIQVVTVPSLIGTELLGTVSVGFSLDEETARRFQALTNSEVAFVVGGEVQASTLPPAANATLASLADEPGVRRVRVGDSEYVAVSRTLSLTATGEGTAVSADVPRAIILRSRTERLRFLSAVHRDLLGTAFLAVLAAILVSYGIARTVTRPLGAITATMREMAATGDLTRRIKLPAGARWEDEDARLLASTFNAMTDSIARFQREAGQRERLSSLGRLSTVVAHEIRNPLMIIKTALRSLRGPVVSPEALRTAVADIDEEITRLNRIVTDVLDFARPIKFELAPADINALCGDAVRAVSEDGAVPVAADFDPALGELTTDAERLRLALVNILMNARHAVMARKEDPPPPGAVHLRTLALAGGRVGIEVRDRGIGIAAEDLPRVFDPYFTTRRTGTGLGLAISRHIIEGLGGTIAVASVKGEGTDVKIELPAGSWKPDAGS